MTRNHLDNLRNQQFSLAPHNGSWMDELHHQLISWFDRFCTQLDPGIRTQYTLSLADPREITDRPQDGYLSVGGASNPETEMWIYRPYLPLNLKTRDLYNLPEVIQICHLCRSLWSTYNNLFSQIADQLDERLDRHNQRLAQRMRSSARSMPLRIMRYMPTKGTSLLPTDGHSDPGAFTLLGFQDRTTLEVKPNGSWQPVELPARHTLIFPGMEAAQHSSGAFPALWHRGRIDLEDDSEHSDPVYIIDFGALPLF